MKSISNYLTESRELGKGWEMTVSDDGMMCAIFLPFGSNSKYGIDGGNISKLTIKRKDRKTDDFFTKCVANYDRGWDIKPVDDAVDAFIKEIQDKWKI